MSGTWCKSLIVVIVAAAGLGASMVQAAPPKKAKVSPLAKELAEEIIDEYLGPVLHDILELPAGARAVALNDLGVNPVNDDGELFDRIHSALSEKLAELAWDKFHKLLNNLIDRLEKMPQKVTMSGARRALAKAQPQWVTLLPGEYLSKLRGRVVYLPAYCLERQQREPTWLDVFGTTLIDNGIDVWFRDASGQDQRIPLRTALQGKQVTIRGGGILLTDDVGVSLILKANNEEWHDVRLHCRCPLILGSQSTPPAKANQWLQTYAEAPSISAYQRLTTAGRAAYRRHMQALIWATAERGRIQDQFRRRADKLADAIGLIEEALGSK